jgi:hypothetical protein
MNNLLPIPIKSINNNAYECVCKYCSNPEKYITDWDGSSYLWTICLLCDKKVWYYHQVCSLYGRRNPYLVCFNCRVPFYEKGIKAGEIYRIAKRKNGI